jgi:hypothetical protein
MNAPGEVALRSKRLLTAKQEAFAVAVASGKTSVEAYVEVYDASKMAHRTITVKAGELMSHDGVQNRVKELRNAAASKAVVTLEGHLNDLLILRNRAVQMGNIGAAIAAEVARGKAAGVHVEKSEVQHTFKQLPAKVDDFV